MQKNMAVTVSGSWQDAVLACLQPNLRDAQRLYNQLCSSPIMINLADLMWKNTVAQRQKGRQQDLEMG